MPEGRDGPSSHKSVIDKAPEYAVIEWEAGKPLVLWHRWFPTRLRIENCKLLFFEVLIVMLTSGKRFVVSAESGWTIRKGSALQ